MSEWKPVEPRPAAVVVLLRDRPGGGVETFMVRRHIRSEFVPDVFVFPGGSVKPSDVASESTPPCAPVENEQTPLGSGFRVAAIRECFEEAGVLLARRGKKPLEISPAEVEHYAELRSAVNAGELTLAELATREGLTLTTDELHHWAHWITPEGFPPK